MDGRNSVVFDNFVSELEMFCSYWEVINKNYCLSINFEFDFNVVRDKDSVGIGLSESLVDWWK